MKKHYIECICYDMDHITRIMYDPDEKEFYFEHKVCKFPGEDKGTLYPMTTFNDRMTYRWERTKYYFKNIWWAIKGVPNWYVACTDITVKEAKKMIKFMEKQLEK